MNDTKIKEMWEKRVKPIPAGAKFYCMRCDNSTYEAYRHTTTGRWLCPDCYKRLPTMAEIRAQVNDCQLKDMNVTLRVPDEPS